MDRKRGTRRNERRGQSYDSSLTNATTRPSRWLLAFYHMPLAAHLPCWRCFHVYTITFRGVTTVTCGIRSLTVVFPLKVMVLAWKQLQQGTCAARGMAV